MKCRGQYYTSGVLLGTIYWPYIQNSTVKSCTYIYWAATSALCIAQELCGSRGGRPGLQVPNSPYGLFARKACIYVESTHSGVNLRLKDVTQTQQRPFTRCIYSRHLCVYSARALWASFSFRLSHTCRFMGQRVRCRLRIRV